MADMGAIERAAGKPPMGPPPGPPPGPEQAGPDAGGGVDVLVQNLSAVGEFLKAQGQNPAAQEAMGHLQALVQSLAAMAGGGGGEAPSDGMMPENKQEGPKIL